MQNKQDSVHIIESRLTRVVWSITNKCNFDCEYCYASSSPKESIGLSKYDLAIIADKLNKSRVRILSLIGGEPLVRRDIEFLIDLIDTNIFLKLDTNGSLLRKKWGAAFERINAFSIGIDGPIEVNEIFRRKSGEVLSAIEFLVRKNKNVNIPILVSNKNFEKIPEFILLLVDLGVSRIQINKYIPVIGNHNKYLALSIEQEDFVINSLIKLFNNNDNLRNKISFSGWRNKNYFRYLANKLEYTPNCKCGDLSAYISDQGYFLPCNVLGGKKSLPYVKNQYHIPNLVTDDLDDSYFNSNIFKDFRENRQFLSPICLKCDFVNSCNHGCRGYAFVSHGDMFSHDLNCNLQ